MVEINKIFGKTMTNSGHKRFISSNLPLTSGSYSESNNGNNIDTEALVTSVRLMTNKAINRLKVNLKFVIGFV